MPTILIDANIEGHADQIGKRIQSPAWRDFAAEFQISFARFRDVGLDPASTDVVVWRNCQANGYYLLTSNRNKQSQQGIG